MTRALAWVLSALSLLAIFFATSNALATNPKLRTTLTPDTIEVGDSATLLLTVTPGDQVSQGLLPMPPNGLSLAGQSVTSQFNVSINNGHMVQEMSARALFRIRASRTGTFTLGAPMVVVNGARLAGDRMTLKVVPKGTLPAQQPDPFDPFGMFGRGGNPFQVDEPSQPYTIEPDYPIDQRLSQVPAPKAGGTFLHAVVDKTQAVVGEQITLSVFVYVDVAQPDSELNDPHEVGTSDFLRQSLLKNDANIERVGFARVGGKVHAVMLLRKYALFPLRAGELEIDPMKVRVGRVGERESETLKVRVSEPPIEHRPAGYTIGDVGRFTLSAEVAPREVERGAAIAVTVELAGWGNLPSALTVPARPGVAWLEPEVKDDLKVLDSATAGASDVWGGSRRFSFVVEAKKEGDIDLGEIAVPFFDPRTHAYDVARASLGFVHVKPGIAPVATDDAKVLANMPALRRVMGGAQKAEAHLDDTATFWGLLAMPTALFGIAVTGRRAARRMVERDKERKASPLADLKLRLRALETAIPGDDAREIDGATIRLLEAGATAHASVNVRGVGGEAVVSVLVRAGVDHETAGDLRDLLEACAAARFSPDGAELADARKRADRAKELVERLKDAPRSSSE